MMEKNFQYSIKKIRTKEELLFLLEEIEKKKLEGREVNQELENELRSLPEIRLEIAFSPEDEFIDRMQEWLEKTLGQKIVLDIIVNPKIVGGTIIEYKGNWRDFSVAKEIDKFILKKSHE